MNEAADLAGGLNSDAFLDVTVEPEKELEVAPIIDTSIPLKPAIPKEVKRRPGRKVSTKKTLLKKIKWMAQNENQKKIERETKKVISEEKRATGEKKPRKRKLAEAAAIPDSAKRRSSRLKPGNEADDSTSTIFLVENYNGGNENGTTMRNMRLRHNHPQVIDKTLIST